MSVLLDRAETLPARRRLRLPELPLSRAVAIPIALLIVLEAGIGATARDPLYLFLYVIAIAAVVLGAATLVRPEATVFGLLFLLFTRLSDVYGPTGGLITVNQVLVLTFVAAMLLHRLFILRQPLIVDRTFLWMLGFAVAMGLSALGAIDRSLTTLELVAYLREILILFVLLNLVTSIAGLRGATWTMVLSGAFLSAAAMLFAVTGYDLGGLAGATTSHIALNEFGSRLVGTVGDPNDFARLLVTLVPMALYRAWEERNGFVRLIAYGSVGLISMVIVLTFSRGGILALVAVLTLAILMHRMNPSHLLAASLAIGIAAMVAPPTFWERMGAALSYVTGDKSDASHSDASLHERSTVLIIGLAIFADHPLFGVGKGNYVLNFPRYAARIYPPLISRPLKAHSLPVQIGAETGLAGLVTLSGIVVAGILSLREAKRRFASAGLNEASMLAESIEIGVYGYIVASLFLNDSFPRFLWLLIGLAMISRQIALRVVPALIAPQTQAVRVPRPV